MTRMFYALQSVQYNSGSLSIPYYGVQSIGASSQGDRTPVFQLGQLGTYSSYSTDDNPVEITISKQLDGQLLLYPTLLHAEGMSNHGVQFNFWKYAGQASGSTENSPTGGSLPLSRLVMNNFTISSVSYTFEVDGVATEEITLIGDGLVNSSVAAVTMDSTINCATDLATRSRIKHVNGGSPKGYQSISFNYSKNIESLYTLGKFRNVERYVSYPTECTIDVTSDATAIGAMGSANTEVAGNCTEVGGSCGGGDFSIELCDGTKITAGNTVTTSSSYQGGDTGGSQLQYVESMSSWDDFKVLGPSSPSQLP